MAANPPLPEARQLAGLDPENILTIVADSYRVDPALLSRHRDPHIARAVAPRLCRHPEITLGELALCLGLSRADSMPNLTRRVAARLPDSPPLAADLTTLAKRLKQVQRDGRWRHI